MAFVVTPSPFKYISVACWCLQEVLSCAVVLEKVRQALTEEQSWPNWPVGPQLKFSLELREMLQN